MRIPWVYYAESAFRFGYHGLRINRTMKKIINCAHRGARAHEPENTVRAFVRAAEMGAQEIETDVFLSADAVPVISHNAKLQTDSGAFHIKKLSLDQIRRLRFRDEPIPTLQETVDTCVGTGMTINIEIKDSDAVEKVVEVIRKNKLYDRCQVSCFKFGVLKTMREIDPDVPLGYLAVPVLKWRQLRLAAGLGCVSVNPLYKTTTRKYVVAAHELGLNVNVWAVNEKEDIRRMILLDVDCIMTDYPDRLQGIKAELGIE